NIDAGFISNDVDGDGIINSLDLDSDNDGIADYLDNIVPQNVIPEVVNDADSFLIECEPGLRCRLGEFALVSAGGGARLDEDDLIEQDDIGDDEFFDPVGGIFDFEIHELQNPGQQVSIVVPQIAAIPANAVYRKFQDGLWRDFVVDDNNAIHSAQGNLGFCPPPGASGWQVGLIEGFFCVQLTIEDGGPNDSDLEMNSTVSDPGVVSIPRATPTETPVAVTPTPTPVAVTPTVTPTPTPTAEPRVITSKSSGGGSAGLGLLFVLMLGFAARFRQILGRVLLSSFCVMFLLPTPEASAKEGDHLDAWFVEIDFLSLEGEQTAAGFSRSMAEEGSPVNVLNFDNKRTGYQFNIGYEFNKYTSMMFGYADLGDADVEFTTFEADNEVLNEALVESHPHSAHGVVSTYRYSRNIKRFNFLIDIGAFFWAGDIETNHEDVRPDIKSRIDPVFGFGLGYDFNDHIGVNIKYKRFTLNGEVVDGTGIGLHLNF
ncbi:MAG: hypothetical protein COA42_16410, partial [Alteromonadaceae bacterium]